MVAVFSSVLANSERHIFFNAALNQLAAKALFILKSTQSVNIRQITRVNLLGQRHCGFQEPSPGFKPVKPSPHPVIAFFHAPHN
jgi:hypothetical protein